MTLLSSPQKCYLKPFCYSTKTSALIIAFYDPIILSDDSVIYKALITHGDSLVLRVVDIDQISFNME